MLYVTFKRIVILSNSYFIYEFVQTFLCLYIDNPKKSSVCTMYLTFQFFYVITVYYEYIGCYLDDEKRVLEDEHKDNWRMSADICFSICAKNWKEGTYFGTQVYIS